MDKTSLASLPDQTTTPPHVTGGNEHAPPSYCVSHTSQNQQKSGEFLGPATNMASTRRFLCAASHSLLSLGSTAKSSSGWGVGSSIEQREWESERPPLSCLVEVPPVISALMSILKNTSDLWGVGKDCGYGGIKETQLFI